MKLVILLFLILFINSSLADSNELTTDGLHVYVYNLAQSNNLIWFNCLCMNGNNFNWKEGPINFEFENPSKDTHNATYFQETFSFFKTP